MRLALHGLHLAIKSISFLMMKSMQEGRSDTLDRQVEVRWLLRIKELTGCYVLTFNVKGLFLCIVWQSSTCCHKGF